MRHCSRDILGSHRHDQALSDQSARHAEARRSRRCGQGVIEAPALGQPADYLPPSDVDIGKVENGKVVFDPWRAPADAPSPPPPAPLPPEERIDFALVGLGRLTLEELLPAFAECKTARVTALVSPGEEGVQDHKLMEAIFQAAESGQPVRLEQVDAKDIFRGDPPAEEA